MGHEGVQIRDLVHPGLTEPLRAHQHSTFKLVKLGETIEEREQSDSFNLQSVTSTTNCRGSMSSMRRIWLSWSRLSGKKLPISRMKGESFGLTVLITTRNYLRH